MVTLQTLSGIFNRNVLEVVGLSTDTKPTGQVENNEIANGSYFYEMDTKKMFMYDKEHNQWLEQG